MDLRDSRDIEHTNLPFQNLLRRIPELNEEFIGWKYLFWVLYIWTSIQIIIISKAMNNSFCGFTGV